MKKIQNTTKNDISIKIKGIVYSVEAGGDVSVSDEVASSWKKIHGFLIVSDVLDNPIKKEEKEIKIEENEEIKEEPKKVNVSKKPKSIKK